MNNVIEHRQDPQSTLSPERWMRQAVWGGVAPFDQEAAIVRHTQDELLQPSEWPSVIAIGPEVERAFAHTFSGVEVERACAHTFSGVEVPADSGSFCVFCAGVGDDCTCD